MPYSFSERRRKMNLRRYIISSILVVLLAVSFIGCCPRVDLLSKAERGFIKMVDKTAAKLDLSEDQKVQLEKLKADIRKNFEDGRAEKAEALKKIKEEGVKENPDISKMTSLLQGILRDEAQRINQAFDLLLGFQKNLNDAQKKKLNEMISHWVKKWH
jgi:hypothetical protein